MSRQTAIQTLQQLNERALAGKLDVVNFLQKNFMLEGSNFLIRKPIVFEQWQVEMVLRPVFDRRMRVPGLDTFLNGLPKKNGKSTLAACVAVDALLLDDPAPEVYSAAGTKDQAGIIFRTVRKAFERSPALNSLVKIYSDTIARIDDQGFYKVLSADASGIHGLNASAVIWDELWNQPSWDLWEALTHSPARAAPFHFVVSYAGYQARSGNLLWDLYSRGMRNEDPRQYTFWRSGADANLASWVTPEYLESQRRRLPEHIFRRLHLNEWSIDDQTKVFRIPAPCWTGAFEDFVPGSIYPGNAYSVGIDLAKHKDFTAWAIIRRDVKPFRLVDFGKLPHFDYTKQVEMLAAKLQRFGNPKAKVDAGAAGTAVIELMRGCGMNIEQFTFTNESKAKIVTDLAIAFEQQNILLPATGRTLDESRAVHDLEAELFNFEPEVLRSGLIRYAAGSGYFDDLVMALCLAYSGASQVQRTPQIQFVPLSPPAGGFKDRYANLGPRDFGPDRWWSKLN